MEPKVFQNATIYGLGYQGPDPYNNDRKLRIYNHNTLTTQKTFGKNTSNDIEFYFNGQFTQNRTTTPSTINDFNGNSLEHILSNRVTLDNTRSKQGNYVEVFTNAQIKNNQANGLISPLSPTADGTSLEALTRNTPEYKNEGIGGYKITAPDGKVYHFSQPVYHFEMVERSLLKESDETYGENNVSEKRQYSSYATHWLLTAITGPDFIDTNNNNIADQDDYGYWVRMDYGKWSDGFVWRNPANKNLKDYASNIKENIGKDDFGTYQFGRKQLYYLDRVVSATQTAYFVKDLRFDASGSDLNYAFHETLPLNDDGVSDGNNNGLPVYPYENGIYYKKQLQLVLEKIVLVNNKENVISKGNPSDPLKLNTYGLNNSNYVKHYQPGFRGNTFNVVQNGVPPQIYTVGPGGFYNEYGNPNILINNESGVYDVKDFENFNYNNATKVIDLEYNYNLAVKDHTNDYQNPTPNKSMGSPGAVYNPIKNPNVGKLCLKSIRFLGRNNFDFMPPYQFEYKGEYKGNTSDYIKYPANAIVQKFGINWEGLNLVQTYGETPIADVRAKDEWGFHKDKNGQEDKVLAAAWTMEKIITPTGGTIEFEHEEDDFYTEAFSRRYWTEDLMFRPFTDGNYVYLEIQNRSGIIATVNNFADYFSKNDRVYLDLWLKSWYRYQDWGIQNKKSGLNITPDDYCTVNDVNASKVTLRCPISTSIDSWDLFDARFYARQNPSIGSHFYDERPRGFDPDTPAPGVGNPSHHHSMIYKILASKVPQDETGGGLRIKSITLKDELNNRYKTSYYYNVPGTGKQKTDPNYKSSGITSYSPVRGQKFVPYQSELPSPGVMYEYVTMEAEDLNGNNTGSTRYHFYTLKPVFDIFNPNIVMKDDDNTVIFKANVITHPINLYKMLFSKSIDIEVNTSLIGQFKSVEEYNNKGQLLSKVEKKYLSGVALENEEINRGSTKESFQSMKSVFTTPNDHPDDLTLRKRLLSISSKKEYSSVLVSTTTTNMHGRTTETYSKTDPETGVFLVVETENAKGLKKKVERVPAYKKYPELGSKTTNPNNRHMLSQEAMVIEKINGKTTSANITTWNKEWSYRDNFGTETSPTLNNEKIWRKHKNFAWKEALSNDGSYQTQLSETNTQFNWTTGTPISNNWKKLSEITRYNHFSFPIEAKDINGNFASSKMSDKQDKIVVSGNARYTEMYYSGAEYVESGNMFEGEVKGANFRSIEAAHTGKYSVKSNVIGDKIFEVEGSSGPSNYYNNPETSYNQTFRPGKYKVSYWVLKDSNTEFCRTDETTNYGTKLTVNKVAIVPSEIVSAGCWVQLNYVVDIPENNSNNTIAVEVTGGECGLGTIYCDDFRMSPLASSINSYVYDQKTDLLACTLGANNMGTAYKYDNAGRLIATYVEDVDNGKNIGGFKLINQIKQNYQSIASTAETMPAKIDNCYQIQNNLSAEITPQCIGDFNNTFNVAVTGGSGNYSYQYKWLKNVTNNTYTNYINGTNQQVIPYVPKFCHLDNPPSTASGAYAKRWDFVVKVKDLNTNFETQKAYSYEGDCQYKKYTIYDSALEISNCYNSECPEEEKTYKIHLKDIGDDTGNIKYEYAYLDATQAVNDPNLTWIDVTSTKGVFCPVFSAVADSECSSGQRKMFRIVMRVTNVSTGQAVIGHFTSVYFGDCAPESMPLVEGDPTESKYQSEKVLLEKDAEGNVIMSNRFK